jgi:hypothetical protein
VTYTKFKRTPEMKYVPDNGWKREPTIAKARADLAKMYRTTRREHPKMARLLFQRLRAARELTKQQIANMVLGYVPGRSK